MYKRVLFKIFPVSGFSYPFQASLESIRDSLAEELVKLTAEVRFYCCFFFISLVPFLSFVLCVL